MLIGQPSAKICELHIYRSDFPAWLCATVFKSHAVPQVKHAAAGLLTLKNRTAA